MGKFILLILILCAALFGCKTPLLKAEFTNKIPAISIGNKYIFYNNAGQDRGIVRCDTIEVVGVDGYCIHFCNGTDNKVYIIDKERFKYKMKPVENKKSHK